MENADKSGDPLLLDGSPVDLRNNLFFIVGTGNHDAINLSVFCFFFDCLSWNLQVFSLASPIASPQATKTLVLVLRLFLSLRSPRQLTTEIRVWQPAGQSGKRGSQAKARELFW